MSLDRRGTAIIAVLFATLLAGCCMPASTLETPADTTPDQGVIMDNHPEPPETSPYPDGTETGPYTYCAAFHADGV